MAVPKKRTSKAKKNSRKSVWKAKAKIACERSLSLAKSLLSTNPKSFLTKEDIKKAKLKEKEEKQEKKEKE